MRTMVAWFVLALSVASLFAQPDSLWSLAYGGAVWDESWCVQPTADGGCLIAGFTTSFGAGGEDILLAKVSPSGSLEWSRTYGGAGDERCYDVALTPDGGYFLGGYTSSFAVGDRDVWLLGIDSNGDSLSSRTYGGIWGDECWALLPDSDGGYVLTGYTGSYGAGNADCWVLKTDANGDTLWGRPLGGHANDAGQVVFSTDDGGYLMVGWTMSFGSGGADYWLVKTDSSGDSLWSRAFGGPGDDWCEAGDMTSDGGVVLSGGSFSFGVGSGDFWLVNATADGDSLWSRTYGGMGEEWCRQAFQTSDGGFVAMGSTTTFGAGAADYWILRTDASGDSLWSRTFGGPDDDWCRDGHMTSDGGYVLTGITRSFGPQSGNFWLVRTGPDPVSHASDHFVPHPTSFVLSVYPNPFNSLATVAFDLPHATHARLSVFDVTGRLVAVCADERFSAGSQRLLVDGSGWASGVYFAHLTAGSERQTVKMQLVR